MVNLQNNQCLDHLIVFVWSNINNTSFDMLYYVWLKSRRLYDLIFLSFCNHNELNVFIQLMKSLTMQVLLKKETFNRDSIMITFYNSHQSYLFSFWVCLQTNCHNRQCKNAIGVSSFDTRLLSFFSE